MHQEVTTDFCPSTLQAISELAIHLAQEQYKNRPGWKGGQGYVRGVRRSGYSAVECMLLTDRQWRTEEGVQTPPPSEFPKAHQNRAKLSL